MKRIRLFGIPLAVSTLAAAVNGLKHVPGGTYICFCNVHTLMTARSDGAYRNALCGAHIAFPDGKPLSWLLKKRGCAGAEQVAGPDFMKECLAIPGSSHYFYGGREETLAGLKEYVEQHCPQARIAGMESPPFRALSAKEEAEAVERMNESGADYIWIGLGAPKQEQFMQRNAAGARGVMLGVGAAFDFLGGSVKRAPKWIQSIGMEWLYRLFQDPRRLWKRYLFTNTQFILLLPGYLYYAASLPPLRGKVAVERPDEGKK